MSSQGFNMGPRSQREWSWLLAIDLFFGGLGGGLFLVYKILALPAFLGLFAIGLVMAGAVVLLMELGHPLRAWRAIARPQTSWISRGVIFVSLFIACGFFSLLPAFDAFSWLSWTTDGAAAKTLGFLTALCALMITLYPAFVLAVPRSVPFWNTPMIPVLFLAQSLLGASGIVLLFAGADSLGARLPSIASLGIVLILLNIVLLSLLLFTMSGANSAARESVRLLSKGPLGWTFQIGVLLLGMVMPLGILLWLRSAVLLAGVCILAGGLLFRYTVLKAGVYVPSALVGLDMSSLKPSTSMLAEEYAAMTARGRGVGIQPPGQER